MNRKDPILVDRRRPDAEPPEPSAAESIVLPLLRFRWSVGFLTVVGLCCGVAMGVFTPDVYTSTGKLLLRAGVREKLAPDTISGDNVSISVRREDVQSELDLLRSDELFEAAANRVNNERLVTEYDPAAKNNADTPWGSRKFHEFQSWWFKRNKARAGNTDPTPRMSKRALELTTEIAAVGRSSVISITHHSHDAKQAQEITQVLLEECKRRHNEFFSTEGDLDRVSEELARANADLNKASQELSEFSKEHGLYDLDQQQSAKIVERGSIEAQRITTLQNLRRLNAELAELRLKLEAEPKTIERLVSPAPQYNPIWLDYDRKIKEAEDELSRMIYGPEAPERRRLEANVARYREEQERTPKTVVMDDVAQTIANVRYEELATAIQNREIQVAGLMQAAEAFEERLNDLQTELHQIANLAPEFQKKSTQVVVLQTKREDLQRQRETYRYLTSLQRRELSNLRILENAKLNVKRSSPQRMKYVMFGLLGGLSFGGVLAFLRNGLNRSVRRPEEIERHLKVPVLAVIPKSNRWRNALR